jgi:hypothetical protein
MSVFAGQDILPGGRPPALLNNSLYFIVLAPCSPVAEKIDSPLNYCQGLFSNLSFAVFSIRFPNKPLRKNPMGWF